MPCRRDLVEDRLPNDQQKYGLKYVTSDTYILIIKHVDETDDGLYLCYLTVTKLVKSYDTIRVRVVGEEVDLSCSACLNRYSVLIFLMRLRVDVTDKPKGHIVVEVKFAALTCL